MAYLSPNIQKNSEITIKICKTWLLPAWLRKITHFEEKKALKEHFSTTKKHHDEKKAQKNTFVF